MYTKVMKTQRPCYLDNAPTSDFDTFEPKYDGVWSTLVVKNGEATAYGRRGNVLASWPEPGVVRCVLVGEYMHKTQWSRDTGRTGRFYAFDATQRGKGSIVAQPLKVRRRTVDAAVTSSASGRLFAVERFDRADDAFLAGFEGIVCKRSRDAFGASWGRIKHVDDYDMVVTGVDGSSIIVADAAGSCRVQMHGGADVSMVGRVATIAGNGRTTGGSVRHPRFLRWHPEK